MKWLTSFFVQIDDTCYIMLPQDQGDWYDLEAFSKLLEAIREKRQLEEIYATISGGQYVDIVFGKPKAIEKLFKKYKLN